MKNGVLTVIAFSLLFAQQVFAQQVQADDVAAMRQSLQSADVEKRCEAARELGGMKDSESVPLLSEMAQSSDAHQRKCAIAALRLYEDPGFCQDFYNIWLSDTDRAVRKAAGMSVVANDCTDRITRNADYAMDSKSCGYSQFFVNEVKDAIAEDDSGEQWKEVINDLNIKETINDDDTPEEILEMRLNLAFAVIDWGESVAGIHHFEDKGSLEKTRKNYLAEIEKYTKKQEYIKQFCPILSFPDFAFWNTIITEEKQ